MIWAKLATLGILKIKAFWDKDHDVITSVHDVTNKILSVTQIIMLMCSCDQSFITPAFIYERSYSLNCIRIWPAIPIFLRGALGSSSIIWACTKYGLKILYQGGKRVKTRNQKVFRIYSYVCRITGGKLVGKAFLPLPQSE